MPTQVLLAQEPELADFVSSFQSSHALLRRIRVMAKRGAPYRCVAHFAWKAGELRTRTLHCVVTTALDSTIWARVSSMEEMKFLHGTEIAFIVCIQGSGVARLVGTLPKPVKRGPFPPLENYKVVFEAAPVALCFGCMGTLRITDERFYCKDCLCGVHCSVDCYLSDSRHPKFCSIIRWLALGSDLDSD